ncbi:3-carboxy-cis,cis-mucoante lactonizing enzyme [Paraphaeosphaeria sporulosa]|uniref:3-carboxy-cis,cis-mucoante lactonizing enzyme n=1 Tax=Paraphaeosphaeria sporulosa TaxID=1460663 RepID=A0A177CS33_9PLEO|nr:3-carboxy-cis,cis-mucoante lactonizing enzyme [Paraphaeosphaeria sporulosa]OAG09778.1 3-carboxy-cis,cis-mucoante lactonizing enzyme [Paraphaeosphaeria sporulosa]
MRLSSSILLFAAVPTVLGDKHYFFSGFFSGSLIAGVEFDDATNNMTLVNNITIQSSTGSKWIAIDERKQNLYVSATGQYQSYSITANRSLASTRNITLPPSCQNANFIAAARTPPYTVFGAPYSTGCAAHAVSVDSTGTLQSILANITYNGTSGVHGLAISPGADFVYSADDMGNAVWTHSFSDDNVTSTAQTLQYLPAPSGSDPRHLAVHPAGSWAYVVYEAANEVAVYARDEATGLLRDTNATYALLPEGFTNTSSYWADEVMFSVPPSASSSSSPKYLIASTRSRTSTSPGYVSAFALSSTGAITEQLFLLPTTASGGGANAVAPASFSEEYFAITDSAANFIEVWKIDNGGKTAAAVAQLGGFSGGPANVVWVN